jgi:phosphoserine phosphatase
MNDINKFSFEENSIVFFDLCETLYDVNTTFSFLDFFFDNNKKYKFFRFISKLKVSKLLNYILIEFFHFDIIRTFAIRFLKNISVSELKYELPKYLDLIKEKKIEVSNNLLLEAINSKSEIYLISASLDFIVDFFEKLNGFTGSVSTTLEVIDDRFTGLIKRDLLGNKDIEIKRILKKSKKSYFITDNLSDANCINIVDYFVVISKKKNLSFWKNKNVSIIYEI